MSNIRCSCPGDIDSQTAMGKFSLIWDCCFWFKYTAQKRM